MTEYRSILERAGSNAPPTDLELEGILRRRDRKRGNQRIAAGIVGIAVFVAAVWVVTSGPFDQSQTPAAPGGSETGPTETGPVAPNPDTEGIDGLPPEGAPPSTPESGELVVQLSDGSIPSGSRDQVWVYADGRVISSLYVPELQPYSGLVEQHLTPEGVEFLRSNVLSTGLFEHDLDLVREDPMCCLYAQVRDGDRLVRVSLGPRDIMSDREASEASEATPEQEAALESLSGLLRSPESWPASAWTNQQIMAYVPTSYTFCSRYAETSRLLALLPERARDLLLGVGYPKTDGSALQPACAPMTTEETRALAEILMAESAYNGGPSLSFSLEKPGLPMSSIEIAINPVLPHDEVAGSAGLG